MNEDTITVLCAILIPTIIFILTALIIRRLRINAVKELMDHWNK